MDFFALTAQAAETSTELEKMLENATKTEAFAGGTVMGMALGMTLICGLVWFVLQVIADWKIFSKAGRPGWMSIIPFLNYYEEYELSWRGKGLLGLVYGIFLVTVQVIDYVTPDPAPIWAVFIILIVSIIALVVHFLQSMRLARSFGKGTGFGVGLFLLGPIFRLILGFGSAQYIGPQD